MRFTFFSFRALCYPETGITLPPVNGVQKLASNHNKLKKVRTANSTPPPQLDCEAAVTKRKMQTANAGDTAQCLQPQPAGC